MLGAFIDFSNDSGEHSCLIPDPSPVLIPASHGHLEALLREPTVIPRGAVVMCHPHPNYGGTMHTKAVYRGAEALSDVGLVALRFNFRGVGASTGSYEGGLGEVEIRWQLHYRSRVHRDVLRVRARGRHPVLAVARGHVPVVETEVVAAGHAVATMATAHGRASGHLVPRRQTSRPFPHGLDRPGPFVPDDEGPFRRPHGEEPARDDAEVRSADGHPAHPAKHLSGLHPGNRNLLHLVTIRLEKHQRFHGLAGQRVFLHFYRAFLFRPVSRRLPRARPGRLRGTALDVLFRHVPGVDVTRLLDAPRPEVDPHHLDGFGAAQIVQPVLHPLGDEVKVPAAHLDPVITRSRQAEAANYAINLIAVRMVVFIVNRPGLEAGAEKGGGAPLPLAEG